MSWYYSKNLKPQGPLTSEEILLKIHGGEIGPYDLLYSEKQQKWRKAFEWPEYRRANYPAWQSLNPHADWVLLKWDHGQHVFQQLGPFSSQEMLNQLNFGGACPEDYIWTSGMSGWSKIKDRPEFAEII